MGEKNAFEQAYLKPPNSKIWAARNPNAWKPRSDLLPCERTMKKLILCFGLLLVSINLIGWWLFLSKASVKEGENDRIVVPSTVLVSPGAESSSVSPTESLPEADPDLVEFAEMGRRVVEHLGRYLPPTKADGSELNPPMVRMLGLDEEQERLVNEIFADGISKVKELEKNNSKVEVLPNGDEKIVIEPFRKGGSDLVDSIVKNIGEVLSNAQLEVIAPNIRNGRSGFGKIGYNRTEIAILEIREGGEEDGVFLEIKRFDDDGKSLGRSMTSIDSAEGKLRRYNHLLEKSDLGI